MLHNGEIFQNHWSVDLSFSKLSLISADSILTSKYNKPFPVTLLPSTIGYYLGLKQGERQVQVLDEIRALGDGNLIRVRDIATHPK